MKCFAIAGVFGAIALLLMGCERKFTDRPEVEREIKLLRNQGWYFVEMVGEAHAMPLTREIRRSDVNGNLTVYATNTGVDGMGDRQQSFRKTFDDEGFDFLEVKIMTSPADGYGLVFRRRKGSEK